MPKIKLSVQPLTARTCSSYVPSGLRFKIALYTVNCEPFKSLKVDSSVKTARWGKTLNHYNFNH